jgi:uncharacterized MnhB-related membrane protein
MTIAIAFEALLMLSIVILAWMSIFSASLFRCIVFFVGVGLLVTIVWGQMGALDVAIAEAAIGAGLTGSLLLAAWNRIKSTTDQAPNTIDANKQDG